MDAPPTGSPGWWRRWAAPPTFSSGRAPTCPALRSSSTSFPSMRASWPPSTPAGSALAVVELGGGRTLPGQPIDPSVGFAGLAGIGTPVGPGATPLGRVLARSQAAADRAAEQLRLAYLVRDKAGSPLAPILERR